jgi:hypothetical protein
VHFRHHVSWKVYSDRDFDDYLAGNCRSAVAGYACFTRFNQPLETAMNKTSDVNVNESKTFTRTAPPAWLLDFWKEIDDKTLGKGFDCFTENSVAHLGVSDWRGRDAIREGIQEFVDKVDKGFTPLHEVTEYWDGGSLKVFRGTVTMTPDDPSQPTVRPMMTHFFYMDEKHPDKVAFWYGSVGPVVF